MSKNQQIINPENKRITIFCINIRPSRSPTSGQPINNTSIKTSLRKLFPGCLAMTSFNVFHARVLPHF